MVRSVFIETSKTILFQCLIMTYTGLSLLGNCGKEKEPLGAPLGPFLPATMFPLTLRAVGHETFL